MSYANFKPDIWSSFILDARDKITVAKSLCWRQFDGDIQKAGDTVHVMGLSGATVKNVPTDSDNNFTDIDSPETLDDASLEIKADQYNYVNFKVDDIDKIQANGDIMSAVQDKTAKNYATKHDAFVYQTAINGVAPTNILDFTTTPLTSKNVLDVLGQAQAIIEDSGSVVNDGDISAEIDPYTFMKFKKAFVVYGNPNTPDGITSGYSGNWFGTKLYHTNSLPVVDTNGNPVAHNTASAIHYIIMRTQEAIAFVEKKTLDLEAYRPEKSFSDAMKGFGVYGAKITRPTDLVVVKVVLGAEED